MGSQLPPWPCCLTASSCRLKLLPGLPLLQELMAGGVAGGFSKTCVAPLERCKILFQTGRIQPGSVFRTLQNILHGEGLPGLFRWAGSGAAYAPLAQLCFIGEATAPLGSSVMGVPRLRCRVDDIIDHAL